MVTCTFYMWKTDTITRQISILSLFKSSFPHKNVILSDNLGDNLYEHWLFSSDYYVLKHKQSF